MRTKAFHALIVCFTGLAFAPSLSGDVLEWSFGKLRLGEQTANNTAPSTFEYEVFAELDTNNPIGDFTSVTLTGPGVSMALDNFGGPDWEFYQSFSTQAAMDAAFAAGTYSLDASVPLGIISEELLMTTTTFTDVPVFTGSVYSDLQGMDASQDFSFSWNAPPPDGWMLFVEEANGPEVFVMSGFGNDTSGDTGVTMAGDTLQAGTDYEAYLVFGSITDDVRDSFLTGNGIAPAFGSETFIAFTTGAASIPEPSGLGLVFFLLAGLALTRRHHRGHILNA